MQARSSPLDLAISGLGGATTSLCLTLTDGEWSSGQTAFLGGGGLTNASCVLAPAYIVGDTSYWVSGDSYDVALEGTPTADGDAVRHSVNTAEDEIVEGQFTIRVYPRDELNMAAALIFEGKLVVSRLDEVAGRVTVSAE